MHLLPEQSVEAAVLCVLVRHDAHDSPVENVGHDIAADDQVIFVPIVVPDIRG